MHPADITKEQEEVVKLINAVDNIKHKCILLIYSAFI
jgi:hypothetical protein